MPPPRSQQAKPRQRHANRLHHNKTKQFQCCIPARQFDNWKFGGRLRVCVFECECAWASAMFRVCFYMVIGQLRGHKLHNTVWIILVFAIVSNIATCFCAFMFRAHHLFIDSPNTYSELMSLGQWVCMFEWNIHCPLKCTCKMTLLKTVKRKRWIYFWIENDTPGICEMVQSFTSKWSRHTQTHRSKSEFQYIQTISTPFDVLISDTPPSIGCFVLQTVQMNIDEIPFMHLFKEWTHGWATAIFQVPLILHACCCCCWMLKVFMVLKRLNETRQICRFVVHCRLVNQFAFNKQIWKSSATHINNE